MSSLISSLQKEDQQFEEVEKREVGFCSNIVSRGVAFAYSYMVFGNDSRECS